MPFKKYEIRNRKLGNVLITLCDMPRMHFVLFISGHSVAHFDNKAEAVNCYVSECYTYLRLVALSRARMGFDTTYNRKCYDQAGRLAIKASSIPFGRRIV